MSTSTNSSEINADIERVLHFWFHGPVKENFAKRWFPSQGKGTQKVVDEEIKVKFGDVLQKLSSDAALRGEWVKNPKGALAAVIVLDQFSRHIFRSDREGDGQKLADQIALSLASEVRRLGWHRGYDDPELVFLLMPLRHSPSISRLQQVLRECDSRLCQRRDRVELLEKFRKATFLRLQHLEGKSGPDDGDILEHHPFEVEDSKMKGNALIEKTHAFLVERWNCYVASKQIPESDAVAVVSSKVDHSEDVPRLHSSFPVLVSLSGGVDSMVIVRILTYLRDNVWGNETGRCCGAVNLRANSKASPACHLPILSIGAIHIDYANRPESGEESRFVRTWCKQQRVEFHVRRIDEFTRGVTSRDKYEKETR
eukprot:g4687.t1